MGFLDVAADFFKNLFSFDQAHPLLFTQFYFWAFFAIVLAFLCVFRNKVLLRNAFLFFVSLFFYYKTSGLFLILFGFVIVYNYLAGFVLSGVRRNFWRKAIVTLSVVVDLSLLCYYKYAYFVTDVVNNLFGTEFVVKDWFAVVGNQLAGSQAFSIDSIFLPVGISFFIFQAISYVVMSPAGRSRRSAISGISDSISASSLSSSPARSCAPRSSSLSFTSRSSLAADSSVSRFSGF